MPAEPSSLPPGTPRKRTPRQLRELAAAMELPFIPIAAVLIAGGLGYLVDGWLHTKPAFALILGLLGFIAGIREVLRRVEKVGKSDGSG